MINNNSISLFVIRFTISSQTKSIEYIFRSWQYIIVKILLDSRKSFTNVYFNNDCIMSIIDKQFLRKFLSNCQIRIIFAFVIIRETDVIWHVSSNYVMFDLWLFDDNFDNLIIIYIIKKIYLINELRVNILININIQKVKSIKINVSKRRLKIDNYVEFLITINVIDVDKRVDRLIRIKRIIFLSSHFVINVFIQIRNNTCLSIDKNYIFYSKINFELKSKNNVYFYIVDVNILMIQIRNIINEIYIVLRHVKLNRVFDYKKKIIIW